MDDRNPDDPSRPRVPRILAGDGAAPPRGTTPDDLWGAQRNWLARSAPANGRHAAITGSLHSWSSYKSWAERVRGNWDKDK